MKLACVYTHIGKVGVTYNSQKRKETLIFSFGIKSQFTFDARAHNRISRLSSATSVVENLPSVVIAIETA